WLSPKSDLFLATSEDGLTFSAPARVTSETGKVVNLFPALTMSQEGELSLLWLSTRLGPPGVFEMPLPHPPRYPLPAARTHFLGPGLSRRGPAPSTPGIYLGVWVDGPEGLQDIFYRYFRRDPARLRPVPAPARPRRPRARSFTP